MTLRLTSLIRDFHSQRKPCNLISLCLNGRDVFRQLTIRKYNQVERYFQPKKRLTSKEMG